MLVIRLARTGRRNQASFRLVVAEKLRTPTGKVVARLGHYNPHSKEFVFDKEATQRYLDNGAQPSSSVVKLFKKAKFDLPKWAEGNLQIKNKKPKVKKKEGEEGAPLSEAKPDKAESGEKPEAAKDEKAATEAKPESEDKPAKPEPKTEAKEESADKPEPKEAPAAETAKKADEPKPDTEPAKEPPAKTESKNQPLPETPSEFKPDTK